jgi:hypothetical protein
MSQEPNIGIPIHEARPLIRAVKLLMVEEARLVNSEAALPKPDRVTVYLSNHGPVFAPFPAPVLTIDHLLQRGGYDDLIAVTLFHRVVEFMPGVSPVLRRYLGHSTRACQSVSAVAQLMRERKFRIIGTVPEGSSSCFTYDEPVGHFTKAGLLVASLEADADIVLTAQKGVEVFGRGIRRPRRIIRHLPETRAFGRPTGVLLPWWSPRKRGRITLAYQRYEPISAPGELASLRGTARKTRIGQELAHARSQLLDLYRSI